MAIVSWDSITNPKPPKIEEDEDEFSPFSELAKGFAAGIDQEQALYGAAKAGIGAALGDEELKQEGFDYYRQQMEEAAVNAPTVRWEDDWDGFSDVGNFVAYTLGNSIPALATTIAGGGIAGAAVKAGAKKLAKESIEATSRKQMQDTAEGIVDQAVRNRIQNAYKQQALNKYAKAGGVVGAAIPSVGMAFGENFARIYEETGLEDPGTALVSGLVSGSLDAFGAPFRALKSAFPDNPALLSDLKDFISDKALTTTGRKRLGNMLSEGVKVAGWEGATEATQEFLTRSAVMWSKEKLPEEQQALFNGYLYNEEAVSNYLHAFVAGSIAGKAIGLGTGAFKSVESSDGSLRLDVKNEQERQEKQLEAKEVVSAAYDAEPEPADNVEIFPDAENVLEIIRSTGKVSRDALIQQTGLDPDRVQESLDVLVERQAIDTDMTSKGVVYGPKDPEPVVEAIPETVQEAPQAVQDVQPEPEVVPPEPAVEPEPAVAVEPDPVVAVEPEPVAPEPPVQRTLSALEEAAVEGQQLQGRDVDFGFGRRRYANYALHEYLDGEVSVEHTLDAAARRIEALNQNVGGTAQQIGGDETFVTQKVPEIPELSKQLVEQFQPEELDFPVPTYRSEDGRKYPLDIVENHFINLDEYRRSNGEPSMTAPENAVGRVANTLIDLIERGMPTDALTDLQGINVIPKGEMGTAEGAHFPALNAIAIGEEIIELAILDENIFSVNRAGEPSENSALTYLTTTLAHELWHSVDQKKSYTKLLPTLRFKPAETEGARERRAELGPEYRVDTTPGNAMRWEMGDVVTELYDAWEAETELASHFDYPFSFIADFIDEQQVYIEPDFDAVSGTVSREVFAQLGSIFIAQPRLLQKFAPKAYRLMKSIQEDPRPVTEVRDSAYQDNQETTFVPDGGPVQRNVRAPPSPGGLQVPDEGGAGGDGVGRDQGRRADSRLAGPTEGSVRDDSGRSLQEGLDQAEFSRVPSPEEDAPILPMGRVEESLQTLLAETDNNPTAEQLATITGAPKPRKDKPELDRDVKPRTLDELRGFIRRAIDDSDNLQWYDQFGRFFRDLVGDANLDEASVIFGITSAQNAAESNLSDTLHVMSIARRVDPVKTPKQFALAVRSTRKTEGQKLMITGQQIEKIISLYQDADFEGGIKTTTYMQTVADRGRNLFIPFSVQDVHMARAFGFNKKDIDKKSGNEVDAAEIGPENSFRYAQYLTSVLADEFGITPNQAQALIWFYAKANLAPKDPDAARSLEAARRRAEAKGEVFDPNAPRFGDGTLESSTLYSKNEIDVIKNMIASGEFDTATSFTSSLAEGIRPRNRPKQKTTPFSNVAERDELIELARQRAPKIIASSIPGKGRGYGFPDDTPIKTLFEYNETVLEAITDEGGQIPLLRELGIPHEIEIGSGTFTGYEPSILIRLVGGNLSQANELAPVLADALLQDSVITAQPVYKEDGMPGLLVEKTDGSAFTTEDGMALADLVNPKKDAGGINFNQPLPSSLVFLDPKLFVDGYDYKDTDYAEFYDILRELLGDGYTVVTITQDGEYFEDSKYQRAREALRDKKSPGGSSNIQDAASNQLYEPVRRIYKEYAERLGVQTEGLTFPVFSDRPPQDADPTIEQAVRDRIARNITPGELNEVMSERGRDVRPLTRGDAEALVSLPSEEVALNALQKTNREKADQPSKETYWKAGDLVDGQKIAARLDIPAYSDKSLADDERTNIVTLHEPRPNPNAGSAGKRIGYYPTVRMTNGVFGVSPKAAANVGTGKKPKSTFATVEGTYVEATDEDNVAAFLEAIDDPEWTQVSMNPRRHQFFYTLDNQDPVTEFSDLIQVGNFAIAKNVKREDPDRFDYMPGLFSRQKQEIEPFKLSDEIIAEGSVEKKIKSLVPRALRQKVVDRLERLKEAEDQIAQQLGLDRLPSELSAYDAENLMHSKAQNQLEEFEKESLEPIVEEIKKAGLDMDQVGAYLLAKHAPERNKVIAKKERDLRDEQKIALADDIVLANEEGEPTGALVARLEELEARPLRHQETGSGMTDAEAEQVLEAAEEAGKTSTLEAIASKVYAMLGDMRQNMVNKGLLDEDTKEDWEATYKFYVPLKGFAAYPEGLDMKSGTRASGFSIKGSESFRAKGRITLPVNPLLVAFKDVEEKIVRAERNVIAQRLLSLLSGVKAPDHWSIWNNRNRARTPDGEKMSLAQMRRESRADDGIARFIQVKRGGQTFFIEVKDRELNRQLQSGGVGMFNNNVDAMNGLLTVLTKFQNFRRNMLINYNPSWGLVNPIRDVQTGLAFALSEQDVVGGRIQGEQLVGKISAGYLSSLKAFWRQRRGNQGKNKADLEYDRYASEYVEDGAPTGLAMAKSLAEQSRRFEKIINQGNFKKKLRSLGDFVEDYNQTTENAIRLSTYVEARKTGVARADAATLAKDLTVNFNRKGEYSSAIDSLYLFFNAAVQGNVNIAKAILRPGKDGQSLTKARALAASMVAWGFARTMMNIEAAGEDDDGESNYTDFNEYVLKTSMVFANPMSLTEGQSYAIPMPYGYGIFDNLGRYAAELATKVKTPEKIAIDFVSSLDHHFNPMSLHASKDEAGFIDAALQKGIGFSPDIMEHFFEQLANINFFGSDIKIPQNSFVVETPASEPTKRRTSEHITAVTRWVNSVTGGSSNVPGAVSMNPEQIQHFIEFLLGGVGRFFDDSADTVGKLISEDPDLRSTALPILRTFMPLPSEYSDRMDYYGYRTKVRQYGEDYKAAKSREEREEVNKRAGYNVAEFLVFDKRVEKDLRKIFDRKKRLESSNVDSVMRINEMQKLAEQEELLFDQFNKRYREATR